MKQILFNTEMVRAILDGRKCVTRRAAFPGEDLKPFPRKDYPDGWWFRGRAYRSWDDAMREPQGVMGLCRYRPGDILYVRETWQRNPYGIGWPYFYKASPEEFDHAPDKWHPSIHMPKEAARLFLRVTGVRVERLQEILVSGMKAEGVVPEKVTGGQWQQWQREYMRPAWNVTIKKADLPRYGWDANPWVWVIEFEQITKEEAVKA